MRVPPQGSLNSKIAIIGEAPGHEEDATGLPFQGAAGRRLNKLLYAAKIIRSECYIDNVIPIRPPNNDVTRLGEIGLSLNNCAVDLRSRLSKFNGNVIVPLGRVALEALTGHTEITKYRGSILYSLTHHKTIPTFHPSYLNRIMGYSSKDQFKKDTSTTNHKTIPTTGDVFLTYLDFLKVKRESEFSDLRLPKRTFITSPSKSTVVSFLKSILDLKWGPIVSVDIEAFMSAIPIKCVGFGVSAELAIVIPIFSNKPCYSLDEEVEIWGWIKKILIDPRIFKIIQNEQYEQLMLFDYVGEIRPVILDNMIAQRLLFPELKLNLAVQASIFTDEPYFKSDAKNAGYTSAALYDYNGKDCTVEWEIGVKQIQMLKENGLDDLAFNLSMPLSRIMVRASRFGILIDVDRVEEYRNEIQSKVNKNQLSLNGLAQKEINVKSPKQLGKFLYGDMNIPKQIKRKSGNITTDAKALENLYARYPSEILRLIRVIIKDRDCLSKSLGFNTKLDKFVNFWDSDLRVRPSWNVAGTLTGRFSCSKNIFDKALNMEQVPSGKSGTRNIRDIFISDPGTSFLVFDSSQVEARIVAYLAESLSMMSVFEKGEDIHALVASWIFNKSIEQCGKGSYERDGVAKHLVHAANYDIGEKTFAEKAKIDLYKARIHLSRYMTKFGIKNWHLKIVDQLRENRTLTTPFGRTRLFNGHWGDALFREAYAYIPQSTAVDFINYATVRMTGRMDARVISLIQNHDEWVFQVPDFLIQETSMIIREECSKPIEIGKYKVVIPIELSVGKNWKDLKEILEKKGGEGNG